MTISVGLFSLLVAAAVCVAGIAPVVLLYLWLRDRARRELW